MGQPFIVLGDQTDHGGQVVEASPTSTTGGKGIARVGDKVTCPEHGHGPTTIVSGDETMLIDGKPAARHGDKCACGATLIATQMVSTAGGSGGASQSNNSSASARFTDATSGSAGSGNSAVASGATAVGTASGAPDEVVSEEEQVVEQHFEFLDEFDAPVSGYRYDLYVDGALHVKGRTMSDGTTEKINGDGGLRLVAWLSQQEGARP